MPEVQLPRVQQHAMHAERPELQVAPAVAVAGIADQVVADVLEMAPDLTEASGLRLAFEQGVARGVEAGRRLRELAAGQASEARDRRLLLGFARPAIERMVDLERHRRRPSAADREIALAHRARHELLAQFGRDVALERDQQAAARRAIQAVDQVDAAPEPFAQAIGGEIALAARERRIVSHQPGRFVDHRQMLVEVDHIHRDMIARGLRARPRDAAFT
jgi:hypothetical protein